MVALQRHYSRHIVVRIAERQHNASIIVSIPLGNQFILAWMAGCAGDGAGGQRPAPVHVLLLPGQGSQVLGHGVQQGELLRCIWPFGSPVSASAVAYERLLDQVMAFYSGGGAHPTWSITAYVAT